MHTMKTLWMPLLLNVLNLKDKHILMQVRMSSSQFTVESYYLPDLSDMYDDCELFWQTATEELHSTEICAVTDEDENGDGIDSWKIPDDWFVFNNEPILSNSSKETEDLLNTYHPSLPPISMAFPLPSVKNSEYVELPDDELCPEFDSLDDIPLSIVEKDDKQEENPQEINVEIHSSKMELEEERAISVQGAQEVSPNVAFSKSPIKMLSVTVESTSNRDNSSSKYTFSDILIRGDSKYKRRKTVRELLLDRQQHMIIHRICGNNQKIRMENSKKPINGVCTVIPIENKDLELFENDSRKSKNRSAIEFSEVSSHLSLNEVPRFRHGKVDAKEHRPRHYEIEELKIGNFVNPGSHTMNKCSLAIVIIFE
ncbi:uncharacterized protein LOC111624848 [Centruroides sculpturatus]|uniref:uncharacterized protein LOC111624848 n=1 Tax=Centruroides sculpturatus TaxID=218467 RepID=UPI000C6D5540|nr:uncharacterized protein LOC111624848 [Centruroides sculpturatus]